MSVWKGLSGRVIDTLSVQFTCNEEDSSHLFEFPGGKRLQVPDEDLQRSCPLRDLIETAATSGETTITFPSRVELSNFRIWAAAIQPDSPVFRSDARG